MSTTQNRLGLTLLEIVVVIFLAIMALLIVLAVLMPMGGGGVRAAARRLTCQTKVKDIVLACNLYEMKHKHLPPSCHVKDYTTADGVTAYNKDGYSFLVDLLPEMEQEALYKRINVDAPFDAENEVSEGDKINLPDEALSVSLPMFRCPEMQMDVKTNGQAITNYKAVSGTTRLAYEVSSRTDVPAEGLDIYGTGTLHTQSDGVMYVGSRTTLEDITDGVTNTLLITETVEPVFSRWIVGQECGVYTMRDDAVFSPPNGPTPFVHLSDYIFSNDGADSYTDSAIMKEHAKTNLDRDYTKSPYPWGENGFRSARYTKEPPTGTRLGPGSAHKGVVMHGFIGGSADALSDKIDDTVYFFLTTRAGDDPGPPFAFPID